MKIVPTEPFGCYMPWHAHQLWGDEKRHGASCCFCDRAVAATEIAKGKTVACIYCGLDRGFLAEEEIEP